MSADTISPFQLPPSTTSTDATHSDNGDGGAGRGGGQNGSGSPLVVVQQGRGTSPPRPAPRTSQTNSDNSLRNGYAAISHSVSSETAAIGLGFLAAGPVGAIVAGATLPVLVAASMWRARRREDDENTNDDANSNGSGGSSSGRDRSGAGGRGNNGGNNGGGRHRSPNGSGGGAGGGGHKTPKSPGTGNGHAGGSKNRKPKVKDPVADKIGKFGKGLADKLKRDKNGDKNGKHDKAGKRDRNSKSGKDAPGSGSKTPKGAKNDNGAKGLKDGLRDGLKVNNRGPQPDSDRPWRGRGHKDKPHKQKRNKTKWDWRKKSGDNDATATSAPDGLDPKGPTDNNERDKRIDLVRAKREKDARRKALKAAKKAASDAARDGTAGDPYQVKLERIRTENQRINLELERQGQLIALAAGTEQRRSTLVTYPVATTLPATTQTAGAAIARQIDVRASDAYRILVAMADQLANGLRGDDDADMADHVVELVGIPTLCRNLSIAVREGAAALQKTAPLHPSVIKHLNNAAVAALTAARMADTILVVFVQAHREDIFRVMNPRIGEERWNLRNGPGTLDAAKLRAAILSSGQQRLALPAGASSGSTNSGRLVPASDGSTKKLITLMKGFDRGHMVNVLSEVAGAAGGVEAIADSVTKLYRRMAKTWPTEDVVDDTVRATASKVRTVAAELRKAIKAAQRAHARELKLNAKPRKGARAEKKWDVVRGRKG